MKKTIFSLFILSSACFTALAQGQTPLDGIPYFLPRTAVRLSILIEKTSYKPGNLAKYAEKYMKVQDVALEESTQYRIVGTSFQALGLPDSTKSYVALADKKHTINDIQRDENGVIMAINTTTKKPVAPAPFVPARKKAIPNPKDYMNADILSATSSAKMAELIALDLYEIRESRNLLSRGQAEFMPKDGEQLKLMLANLNAQETALMQVFEGTTTKDTTEVFLTFIPTKEVNKELLFRFSKHFGICDKDDLGGSPYYISVEDMKLLPELQTVADDGKRKDYAGIHVNLPGKIKITLFNAEKSLNTFELYAGQFGRTVTLSGELFGKKQLTRLVLNPVTGNIENVQTEILK